MRPSSAVFILLFIQANRRPQQSAFALLETAPTTPSEAQALLDHEEQIRAGLLNTYLAPQRYISAVGDVRHISELYQWGLGLSSRPADCIQSLYEVVAAPLSSRS